MPQKPTIYIVLSEAAQVGKEMASKAIAEQTGENIGRCSDLIGRWIAEQFDVAEDTIANRKTEIRKIYEAAGNYLCEKDPAYLTRNVFETGHHIIDGIRRRRELLAFIQYLIGRAGSLKIYWIASPRRGTKDNSELTLGFVRECARPYHPWIDLRVIENTGTLEEYREKLETLT